jgi:hypothetical protein
MGTWGIELGAIGTGSEIITWLAPSSLCMNFVKKLLWLVATALSFKRWKKVLPCCLRIGGGGEGVRALRCLRLLTRRLATCVLSGWLSPGHSSSPYSRLSQYSSPSSSELSLEGPLLPDRDSVDIPEPLCRECQVPCLPPISSSGLSASSHVPELNVTLLRSRERMVAPCAVRRCETWCAATLELLTFRRRNSGKNNGGGGGVSGSGDMGDVISANSLFVRGLEGFPLLAFGPRVNGQGPRQPFHAKDSFSTVLEKVRK